MQFLTFEESRAWCRANNIPLTDREEPVVPTRTGTFKIPVDSGQRIALVRGHFEDFLEEELLVWITEWGVWPSSERPHIFQRFRASYGEHRPLIEVPAQLFNSDEHEDALSTATLATLFLWDCYVIGKDSRKLLFYPHDEFGHK